MEFRRSLNQFAVRDCIVNRNVILTVLALRENIEDTAKKSCLYISNMDRLKHQHDVS